MVGTSVVGAGVVAAWVVGASVVAAGVVAAWVVGTSVVGAGVVAAWVVGASVVGASVGGNGSTIRSISYIRTCKIMAYRCLHTSEELVHRSQ